MDAARRQAPLRQDLNEAADGQIVCNREIRADTQTAEGRAAWVRTLDAMVARKPAVVVPGHMAPSAAIDASAIRYTRDYLVAFEEELAKAADSAALIAAMTRRYPDAGMGVALQIGAKVAKGEMKWG